MKIGLIDVDSHNCPNLPLMKLSAWHKQQGHDVEWHWGDIKYYDLVYMSKVFDETYSPDVEEPYKCGKVIKGGTGYGLDNALSDEIEHIYPDYSLYGITDTAYGFLSRGCPRNCPFCIVSEKEGQKSVKVADVSEWWRGQKFIKLLDPNILACRDHVDLLSQLAETKTMVDFTQGLDARMLNEDNINLINRIRLKQIHFAWDLIDQSERIEEKLRLYAKMCKHRPHGYKGSVYVLTNFNTSMEENLYRIYWLREMNFDPYVMVYDKPNALQEIIDLQGWVNNKRIWGKVDRFEDYK